MRSAALRIGDARELLPGEEAALGELHPGLHPPLILRRANPGRVGGQAPGLHVLQPLPVPSRVQPVRLIHHRLQVVRFFAHENARACQDLLRSNYLSSVDPAWAAKVGTAKTLTWPVGEGAEGNGSVTSTVFRTPFSIGYVEQAYSQGLVLPFAAIRNQTGNYVLPSTQTIAAAAAQKPDITPTDFSIINQPGTSSYPISGYSWALIYTHQPNQATGQALVTMLAWLTHNGQAYAAANLYVPLPAQAQQLARTMLQQVTGPTGTHLAS